MQQYEVQRTELEDMKQAVESDVNTVMARKEDIDARYKRLLESIDQSRLEYEVGMEVVVATMADDVVVENDTGTTGKVAHPENVAENVAEGATDGAVVAGCVGEVTERALVTVQESNTTGESIADGGEKMTDAELMGEQ